MEFILLGCLGFGLLFVSDMCGLKGKCRFQNLLAFSGTFFVFISSVIILMGGTDYNLSLTVRLLSGFFALGFLLLLIYSVVFEVRAPKDSNKPGDKPELVTTGTYALSRHPGVIWFLFYYVFGSLFFMNSEILIAGIIWSSINVVYVLLQERVVFHKLFENYNTYSKDTPMIIPNIKSIKKCINTINGRKQ